MSYDAVGNVLSRTATEAAVSGQSGTGGSEVQNFCYNEQNRLIWASNNATVPSAGNGTCGNVQYQSTLGGNYTTQYVYTNLGQLWQGPKNGGSTQEQYLYCDSAHPHQLSNLSQTASTPTCSSKGTVDYTGTYDSWGNTNSQVRDGITRTLKYDGLDHLVRWSSSVNSQQEWNLYDASGERVLRRTYDGTNTVLTVFAFGVEEHAYSYSGSGGNDTNTSNTYYYTLGGRTLGTWDGTSPGSPTTNFLLTDTLGSVVSSFNNLPNGAAVVLGDQVYGPYGNRRVQQGTISTSKGFTGQFTDFVAGLDYYGARYYDPVVGVFVSADTGQGNGAGMNPYEYVGGNPESYNDPSGQYRIGLGGLTCAFSGCVESEIPIVNDNRGPTENPNPLGNDLRGPVVNDALLNDLPGIAARDATNIAQEWAKSQEFWNNLAQNVGRILEESILTSSGKSGPGRRPPFNAPPRPAAEEASSDPNHPAPEPVLGGAVQTGIKQNQLGGKKRGLPDVGKLIITDAEGNLVYGSGLYEGKGSPSTHTESLAVNDALDWLQTFADAGKDYNVNIITEYAPCRDSCKINIQSGNWQNQLDDAAYLRGATADLSVWWHQSSQKEFGKVTLFN